MIKKILRKRKVHNQGNTFIMVVATLSFLAVLVAAMLVAVALCYRLKAYDINARDNFYYLEQAMDEIYAGVGTEAMKHLNTAYDDTIEVLVFYDTKTKSYVTMDDDDANRILKNTYMQLLKSDGDYSLDDIDVEVEDKDGNTTIVQMKTIEAHLNSFISNQYNKDLNPEGVKISVENVVASEHDLTIKNLVLKRQAAYSTVNARSGSDSAAADTFVQTITTDVVIGEPDFNVNFNTIDSNLSELYKFAFVADQGIEIGNATSNVNIIGNIYAAADYYNKEYNETYNNKGTSDTSDDTGIKKDTDELKNRYAKVSSDDFTKDRILSADGKNEKSMYSGLYINGATVTMASERIIVPGTIAAFNGADLTVIGTSETVNTYAEIWADGIVLGGYSFLKSQGSTDVQGSIAKIRANAFVYDDLEINAKGADFTFLGDYYGYNYASTDNRLYTDVCVAANGGRRFVTSVDDQQIRDGATLEGQAHYNSSAIIVNGEDSSLDLSGVNNMYIAGQSYIETSKKTTTVDTVKDATGKDVKYTVQNKNGENETVAYNTYDYEGKTTTNKEVEVKVPEYNQDGSVKLDDAGNIIYATTEVDGEVVYVTKKEKVTDNYTTNSATVENNKKLKNSSSAAEKAAAESTDIQDYRTGEAISIKSNQLAYIPNWAVNDTADGLYLTLPAQAKDLDIFKNYFTDVSKIPIIKTVVSGKVYYFFDFSTEATEKASVNTDVMNQFIADYAKLFELAPNQDPDKDYSAGELAGLTNITDYDYFKIEMLKVNADYDRDTDDLLTPDNEDFSSIYSNSAISVKSGTTFTIKAKSSSIAPLTKARDIINSNIDEQNSYIKNGTKFNKIAETTPTSDSEKKTLANNITAMLQEQYQEVKWTLTPKGSDANAIQLAHDMRESDITPINYFFYFDLIGKDVNGVNWTNKEILLNSGYKVWINEGDVKVTKDDFSNGNVKGLIICKGDVTFEDDVNAFEGLIVSGGKVKIEHSMNVTANEEIVKTILRECDESQQYQDASKNHFIVCQLFQHYESYYEEVTSGGTITTESTKSISAVQFEDILGYNNWKKNVD